jgi:conjugative relaxase-like TrwC/TraI family protein
MMTLKSLSGGPGAARNVVSYCQHECRRGDGYYSKDATPSAWGGSLASELGLAGRIDGKTLQGLLEGRLPDGRIFGTSGVEKDGHRRMAVDMTFSAPKSVSLYALGAATPEMRDKMLAAHDRAAARAMRLVEQEFLTARYGKGGAQAERTGAGLWAAYRHEDARPVAGHTGMQVHTHAVLLNVTKGRDGQMRAVDLALGNDGIKLAGATYRAELASELRALGFDLRQSREGFELSGISDEQIEAASARSAQVEAQLEKWGLDRDTATAAQKTAANLSTREDKRQLTQDEQRWEWRQEARDLAITVEPQSHGSVTVTEPEASVEAVAYAVDHLSERESVMSTNRVRLDSLLHGMHRGVTLDKVTQAIESAARTSRLYVAGRDRIVTRETLRTEAMVLERVAAGRGTSAPITTAEGARARIAAREEVQGFQFTAGQRSAVAATLTSADQCVAIIGAAGGGKSMAMAALSDEAHARGLRVVGLGPSQTAADGLKEIGADDTRTLHSFVARADKDLSPRFIILDEAAMVSARDMQRALEKLRPDDRVVFVGDPRQLDAVEAGKILEQMIQEKAISVSEITEINRQRDPELLAIAQAFANGDAARAVDLAEPYMSAVTVTGEDWKAAGVEPPTPAQAKKDPSKLPPPAVRQQAIARETAARYLALSPDERGKTLLLSGTNAVRRTINDRIRQGLQESGAVGPDAATVTALDKAGLTRAEMRNAVSYKPGMVLRLTEGRGRDRKTANYTVTVTDPTRRIVIARAQDGPERVFDMRKISIKDLAVFTQREMAVAPGDRVVFTDNNRTFGFRNNETGTVREVAGGAVTIEKDDKSLVVLDAQAMHAVDYGWGITVHRSQGRTIDRSIVAGEASRVATSKAAYVSCSRERLALDIVTDDIGRLKKAWAATAERLTGHEAMRDDGRSAALEALRAEAQAEIKKESQEQEKARAKEQAPEAQPGPAPMRYQDFEMEM